MPFSGTSASFICFLWEVYHSSPILRSSKLIFPAIILIQSHFQPWILHLYLILEFILPRWSQDNSTLRLWLGVYWWPGTSRDLLCHHERPNKSTSWLWLVIELPCTSSYCVQVHADDRQVGFSFLIFCLNPIPRVSRPGLTLCSVPTWQICGVHRTFVLVIYFNLRVKIFPGSL